MIRITHSISIGEEEIEETFIRASGPGGQNVNKVATAVQLRFDVRNSPNLPEPVRRRLEKLCGQRLTNDGVLVLTVQTSRSQDRNRTAARDALVDLIRTAAIPPTPRHPTKPTYSSRLRRLDTKSHRATIKQNRTTRPDQD